MAKLNIMLEIYTYLRMHALDERESFRLRCGRANNWMEPHTKRFPTFMESVSKWFDANPKADLSKEEAKGLERFMSFLEGGQMEPTEMMFHLFNGNGDDKICLNELVCHALLLLCSACFVSVFLCAK